MEKVGEYYVEKLGSDFPDRMEAKFQNYDLEEEGLEKLLSSIENTCPEMVLTVTRLAAKWGGDMEDIFDDIF